MGNYYSWPALVSLSLVAGLLSWTVYDLDSSKGELRRVRGELMSTADQLLRKSEAYEALSRQHAGLAEALKVEREKNKSFEGQIGEIASTVGALEKLRKTDPQLLQKYSK
ncbi:MAG TPA: hypothetical protein VEB60_02945, partial [Candidatus Paceibacterota bacterium]|nr:hypothetical protein [Candidatus Paceibacterota bacterium]